MKIKKIMAMLLAATMIMGTSVTTFAAQGVKPTENDGLNVKDKIENVETSAQITAYQIIDAKYTNDGFVGYKWVAGLNAGQDVEFDGDTVVGLTDEYVTAIAGNPEGLTQGNLENLNVGTWMLLVTGSDLNKVYNPMIISVYYTEGGSDNGMDSGTVDANTNWELATNGAYAKSSTVPVTKTVDDNNDIGEKDQAAVGDTVTFTIDTDIPSFGSHTANPTFVVTDSIVNGLAYKLTESNKFVPTVKVGGNRIVNNVGKYEVQLAEDKKSFTITFNGEYLKSLAGATTNRDLLIIYDAVITEDAITKVGENDVTVNFGTGTSTAKDYTYTVSFDGIAKKIGEDEDADGLAGAEFTLYEAYNDDNNNDKPDANELTDVVTTATTSEENGYTVDFKGLDADKKYYLKETKAPANKGYTINDTVYTITFANVSEAENGEVTYDVLVDGKKVATVAYGQKLDTPGMTIENTKLSSLPSTGGIGTTIFTIGGCAIMIAAAGLFFASRRKANK